MLLVCIGLVQDGSSMATGSGGYINSVPDQYSIFAAFSLRLSSLAPKDWNAVSLGEKTIDLEVYVLLKSLQLHVT